MTKTKHDEIVNQLDQFYTQGKWQGLGLTVSYRNPIEAQQVSNAAHNWTTRLKTGA